MVLFINQTESIGIIIQAATQNLTGDIVGTFFLILLCIMALAIMFGIPLEFTAIIVLPLCIVIGAFYSNFMIAVAGIVLFLAFILAKNTFFN